MATADQDVGGDGELRLRNIDLVTEASQRAGPTPRVPMTWLRFDGSWLRSVRIYQRPGYLRCVCEDLPASREAKGMTGLALTDSPVIAGWPLRYSSTSPSEPGC